MSQPNNGSLFNQGIPALPIGDTEEGKTWAAFWTAQAEWTAKVANTAIPKPKPESDPDR
jgi:hypothetical protein